MLAALGVDTVAEQVYRAMLARPDWGVAELCDVLDLTEAQVRAALDRLFELALIRESFERPGVMRAVSPEVGLQAALARQHEEFIRREQQIVDSQAAVTWMLARHTRIPVGAGSSAAEQLLGMDAIQERLEQFARETAEEVLTFMPGGAQSAPALEAARRNDTQLLHRNVRIRTIGMDGIRNDPRTLAYAQFLTDGGAEFRTTPLLPPRMILIDRRAALVPIDPQDTRKGALCLTSPGAVASMLALFEQYWDIATPLGADRTPDRQGLTAQERALLKLLSQGMTDEAAATRLQVSHRTARRIMAELMERLGARSRFEAGLKAAQHGWL